MRGVLIAALLVGLTSPARADETQVWESLTVMGRSGKDSGLAGWFDFHARRRDTGTLFILRPGLGYAFSPEVIVHVGYAYIPVVIEGAPNPKEQRTWQQLLWNIPASDQLKLQLRLRAEQRFGAGDDVGFRARGLVRAQYQPSMGFPLQLVSTNEIFYQFNDLDWGPEAGFDQNRFFIGVGAETAIKGVRIDAGYMNVLFSDRMDHVLAINLIANLVPSE